MRKLTERKKKIIVSAIALSAMAALASCDTGLDGLGGSGGGDDGTTLMVGKNYGMPGTKKTLLRGTSLSRVNTPEGPKEVMGEITVDWNPGDAAREIKNDASSVTIKGLPAGTELYLIRTNPSGTEIPGQDIQYVRSAKNVTLGKSEGMASMEGVVIPEGLQAESVSLPDPQRADPWEPAAKKLSASGKT